MKETYWCFLYPIHPSFVSIYVPSGDQFQIWVYGNSFESSLIAVINPNQQVLEQWAEQNGISGSLAELCENSGAKEHFVAELSKIAKGKKVKRLILHMRHSLFVPHFISARIYIFPLFFLCQLKGFEFIRAVHLDPLPFDMERDLITPTYKKKRPQMLKYYQVRSHIKQYPEFWLILPSLFQSYCKLVSSLSFS
jgi:long-chain acyl-CoA synthetase